MFRRSRTVISAACIAVVGLLAGCGIAGIPVAAEPDVRKLEIGDYPVDRYHYDQDSHGNGALLEGIRMAEAVVPTSRIDPKLTFSVLGGVVAEHEEAAAYYTGTASIPVLDRRKMLMAYGAVGADRPYEPFRIDRRGPGPDVTIISQLLMRFPSATDAEAAARELEAADFDVAPDQNKRLQLDKYPDAHIHWRPDVANIGSFIAYREFVLQVFIQRPRADERDLLGWLGNTFDAELAVVEKFRATPIDRLADLKVDPDGLLARAVVRDRRNHALDLHTVSVDGPALVVHTDSNQATAQRMIDETGLDAWAIADDTVVYRVRDAASGPRLVNELIARSGDEYDPIDAPKDVPGAICQRLNRRGDTDKQFKHSCYVSYKRYVGNVNSDNEADVRQKVAAQYALFANSL
jgi:hypothetical protein